MSNINPDSNIKVLRMLIVLRLIRIFKFSTFSLGVKVNYVEIKDFNQRTF